MHVVLVVSNFTAVQNTILDQGDDGENEVEEQELLEPGVVGHTGHVLLSGREKRNGVEDVCDAEGNPGRRHSLVDVEGGIRKQGEHE